MTSKNYAWPTPLCFAWLAMASPQIAYWTALRAVVIQDVVVIDGGDIFKAEYADNRWSGQTRFVGEHGMLYNISLQDSFNTTDDTDIENLLNYMPYETEPNYTYWVFGAMFTNDHEFYTFGGLATSETSETETLYGDVYQRTSNNSDAWSSMVYEQTQNTAIGAARFLANGAWVSAAPVSLGFWFSGLRAENSGPVRYQTSLGDIDQANTTATQMVQVDMSEANQAVWTTLPWSSEVDPRAEGGLIWLPYGAKGLLLALGGIQLPADMAVSGIFPNVTYTNDFMNSIVLYDIDSATWAVQKTRTAFPGQLASFCAVSVAAQDNTSHQIYVYGGYDGTYASGSNSSASVGNSTGGGSGQTARDEIWVLSIPHFKWTLLSAGSPEHRRQNHVCVVVKSTQMLSIGGNIEYGQALERPDFLDVLDLSSGQWTHRYTVDDESVYKIPATIVQAIGGSETGGASVPDYLDDNIKKWLTRPFVGAA